MPNHYHKCFHCGFIWRHSDRCIEDEEAHTCKRCGRQTWTRYEPTPEELRAELAARKEAANAR